MREQDTGILCEKYFEKDHFIARNSKSDIDLDSYDNMVYACSKCNGTKADKDTELLLNPCKDDIYLGPPLTLKIWVRMANINLLVIRPKGCNT